MAKKQVPEDQRAKTHWSLVVSAENRRKLREAVDELHKWRVNAITRREPPKSEGEQS